MPAHTANGGTYTGYPYHFAGSGNSVSGEGQVLKINFTSQLNEYLANGGDPKFTLAMLSADGSRKFASINHGEPLRLNLRTRAARQ